MTETTTLARRNGAGTDLDEDLALVPAPAGGLAPLYDVAAARQQMAALQAFVNTYLRPSTPGKTDGDYGTVPGTDRPTLLKPGADKLCDVYGLLPLYEELGVVEEWAAGLFAYRLRCRIVRRDTGAQVGEGVGACNSRETKYQDTVWWNEHTPPPADSGWTETKRGGKWFRKVPNANAADLVNTILKMAKKRALVDAVLSVTRSSGLFTQDLEDYAPPAVAVATDAQLDRIATGCAQLGTGPADIVRLLGAHLTQEAATALLNDLRQRYKDAQAAPPVTPAGEPVNPATGEIAGEAVEIPADAPTATAVRQVVVAPGDEAAWAGLARGDRGTPPEAAVRADLRQRFLSAVAACGRDTDKVEAVLLKKYKRPFPALTVAEQEHACEVLEAEAEHIHGDGEAEA